MKRNFNSLISSSQRSPLFIPFTCKVNVTEIGVDFDSRDEYLDECSRTELLSYSPNYEVIANEFSTTDLLLFFLGSLLLFIFSLVSGNF